MPHAPAMFSCPHCQTPLRIRHRPIGALNFACPDCQRPLELFDDDGALVVRPAGTSDALRSEMASPHTLSATAVTTTARRRWHDSKSVAWRYLTDPLTVTWIAAALAATVLIVAVIRERSGMPAANEVATVPPNDRQHAAAANEAVTPIETSDKAGNVVDSAIVEQVGDGPGGNESDDAEAVGPIDDANASVAVAVVQRPPVVAEKPAVTLAPDRRQEIEKRLRQRVVLFEQPTPTAFETLRVQMEELAAVSIDYDEALGSDPPQGRTEVRAAFEDESLAKILDDVSQQAGLEYVIDSAGIRLIPRSATTDPNSAEKRGLP